MVKLFSSSVCWLKCLPQVLLAQVKLAQLAVFFSPPDQWHMSISSTLKKKTTDNKEGTKISIDSCMSLLLIFMLKINRPEFEPIGSNAIDPCMGLDPYMGLLEVPGDCV